MSPAAIGYIMIIIGLVITNAILGRWLWLARAYTLEAQADALHVNGLLNHYRDRANGLEAQLEKLGVSQ